MVEVTRRRTVSNSQRPKKHDVNRPSLSASTETEDVPEAAGRHIVDAHRMAEMDRSLDRL